MIYALLDNYDLGDLALLFARPLYMYEKERRGKIRREGKKRD